MLGRVADLPDLAYSPIPYKKGCMMTYLDNRELEWGALWAEKIAREVSEVIAARDYFDQEYDLDDPSLNELLRATRIA